MPLSFTLPPLGEAVAGIELIDIVVGLAIVLVSLAGWVFLALTGNVVKHIPWFGQPLASALNLIEGLWKRGSMNLISGSIHKVANVAKALWSVVSLVWTFVFVVVGFGVTLARHVGIVHQQSQAGLAALRAQEQSDVQIIDRYIENLQTEVTDQGIFDQTYTDLRIANLQAREDREIAAAKGYTDEAYARLHQALNADIGSLANTMTQENLGLQHQLSNATSTINQTISRDVTDLKAADAGTLRQAEQFATGLVSGLGLGNITHTLTALQGQVSKIATETTECLDPLCDTVTPQAKKLGNLGKLLSELEALGVEAALVALAAECLTDPQAVVEDVTSVVNAVGEPIVAAVRDVIGA